MLINDVNPPKSESISHWGLKTVDGELTKQLKDAVNNPQHYNHRGIECISAIEASMAPSQFQGYLKGNIIKYLWRYEYKNGLEDLKKAQWYLNKLIEKTPEKLNDLKK